MTPSSLSRQTTVVAAALLFLGCSRGERGDFLGSAIVEVRTYQVGASVQGPLIQVLRDEGEKVERNEHIALIDTVPYALRLREIEARQAQLGLKIAAQQAEIAAAESEVQGLKRERERIEGLARKGSVPRQQKDKLETRYATAQAKLNAARRAVRAASAQLDVLETQKAQAREQLKRCTILSPSNGTVLVRFRNEGEMAGPGFPLYEIASYDTVQVDFFVPQPVLSELSIGKTVRIRVDQSRKGQATYVPARVTWIADEAEFSPKNIQTRESRNELVFQVRAQAPNTQRLLKRGLPVEIWRESR